MLELAAALCFLIGIAHSYLGERYLLQRLFRRDNTPHLFGDDSFTKGTLRFCWHIMTVLGCGFGYVLWSIAAGCGDISRIALLTTAVVFAISGVLAIVFTRGRHLSWIVFFAISGLTLFAAMTG